MPRRDLESQMRLEDAILDSMLALPSRRRDDEDDDYDVYLFWPSSPESHAQLSERLSQGNFSAVSFPTLSTPPASNEGHLSTYPSVYRPSIDSEDGMQPASVLPPPSPTYTFVSDYVFPEREAETGMDIAGYSRIFTAGLALTSRQITRQIGSFYRDLQRAFNWSSWVRRTA